MQFLDGCWRLDFANGFNLFWKRCHAVFIDLVTQKLEAGLPKNTFFAIDYESVRCQGGEVKARIIPTTTFVELLSLFYLLHS